MFASLKNKIKEETGSDISKITSSWRNGAFLGRIALRDDSSTTTPSSSGEQRDNASDSISSQMESYISERTGGLIDQTALEQQYTIQLENKLKERDSFWEAKIEEIKMSMVSQQGEESAATVAAVRAAQQEAARLGREKEIAEKQLESLKPQLAASERAQEALDKLTEEIEKSRREWARERSESSTALGEAQARARDLADELALVRAALPKENPLHRMHPDDERSLAASGCEQLDRVSRERAVLARQLQEAKVALDDVRTSWSGQIAALETQVSRLSRQAGEEGSERRRVENEKRELLEKLSELTASLEKAKQNFANSDAKVARLDGEVHALAKQLKALRAHVGDAANKTMELENRIAEITKENEVLKAKLENEISLQNILREKLENSERLQDELKMEINHLNSMYTEIQHDYLDMQRKYEKQKQESDSFLLRNAQVSQTLEMSQCDVRYLEAEAQELKAKLAQAEASLADHTENQAACMLIKQNEDTRSKQIEELQIRIEELNAGHADLRKTIQDLETELCDKNKKIKTLDNRILDMKKTLQRELQSSKSDLSAAEEQDISRRYLKHVVLRCLTSRELEAQLVRALAALLRLSAHEEALLRAALGPRPGLTAWLPSFPSLPQRGA